MKLEPLFARVIVRCEPIDKRLKTSLFIPESTKERHQPEQGEVVAVGPSADASVTVGSKVLWGRYAAKQVPGIEDLWIMQDEDILGIVRE
jgi:co-chaperonin GroES (HSP10)